VASLSTLPTIRIRRRSLHSEGDQVHPSQEHQSQTPLLLPLRPLVLWLNLSELLTVGQYKVHVPVKCQEGTDEHAAIQKGDPHAVLHVLTHLPFTRHHLLVVFVSPLQPRIIVLPQTHGLRSGKL
jgi:hypothetical protein